MLNNEASMGLATLAKRTGPVHWWATLLIFVAGVAPATAETVRIAVAGPAAGPMAATAEAIAAGARAALKVVDPAGGTYEVTIKDDGCDATRAEDVAKEIVAETFDLVLGHPCDKAAIAAAKVYGAAGVTFIATETRHRDLTAKRAGPSIIRLSGRDDAQGLDAARYLVHAHQGKPIAVVHDRTVYSQAIAEQALAVLREKKIEVITATIVSGDKDYAMLIAKIKDAGAVLFAGFPMEAGFILQEFRASGSTALFLVTDAVGTGEFVSSFSAAAKSAVVLRASHYPSGQMAFNAVALFHEAGLRTMGPFRHRAEFNAARVASLNGGPFGFMLPAPPGALAQAEGGLIAGRSTEGQDLYLLQIDANGNSSHPSYAASRWEGERWTPVPRDGLK